MADGLVVQGVLLTVLVTSIGLLAIASRVASSREGAAAGSLAAAARQAAEFGFSEIVAEMNRDSKSYLWVTPYASWQGVGEADLQACGIYASAAPGANPIEGASNSATTSKTLPSSDQLSYSLTDFQAPTSLSSPSSATCAGFGNRKGGTATLTVVGTARRGTGDTTTYTLKRSVSVRRAEPVFRRSIFTAPASQANLAASDPRFPTFPTPASLGATPIDPWPAVSCAPGSGGGSVTYQCGTETFDNSKVLKFPYTSSCALASFCGLAGAQTVCMLSSLTLNNVDLVVGVQSMPVNLFVDGDLVIASNANLCSDASGSTAVTRCAGGSTAPTGNWKRLRLFGKAPGAACNQQIQLNGTTAINLQNAFLWLPAATLTYPSLTTLPSGLVGRVCSIGAPASNATVATLTPNQVFEGLGDESNGGIFPGGVNQPEKIRFVYRGYGSLEQQLQP